MSTKSKSQAAVPSSGGQLPAGSADAAAVAWEATYGAQAGPPRDMHRLPMGNLPAGAAQRIAEMLPRAGLPQRVSMVLELTLPDEAGGLPQLRFIVPEALLEPLRRIGDAAGGEQVGAAAGLAAVMGAAGMAQLAVMRPAAVPAFTEDAGADLTARLKLEEAVNATRGLLRMAEAGSSDPSWLYEQSSPIWALFRQASDQLETAYQGHEIARAHLACARPEGIALKVLEAGGIPALTMNAGGAA